MARKCCCCQCKSHVPVVILKQGMEQCILTMTNSLFAAATHFSLSLLLSWGRRVLFCSLLWFWDTLSDAASHLNYPKLFPLQRVRLKDETLTLYLMFFHVLSIHVFVWTNEEYHKAVSLYLARKNWKRPDDKSVMMFIRTAEGEFD